MKRPDRSSRRGFLGSLRRAEEAATLAFTAVALGILLGSAALAVDLGMLIAARVQSQRAADSGALAGAAMLTTSGGTEAMARLEAKTFADEHEVLTKDVDVNLITDIDVVGDTVRVRVRHTLPTLFARIMGINEMDVSTVAAAEAVPAGEVNCPIPVAAIDQWRDHDNDATTNLDSEFNGQWDGSAAPANEYYLSCKPDAETGESPEGCTGFRYGDEGSLLEIKTMPSDDFDPAVLAQTCQANTSPGWLCWIAPDGGGGASALRDVILNNCRNNSLTVSLGGSVDSETGNVQSAVGAFRDLINANGGTNVAWDGTCVRNLMTGGCEPERLRALPLVDPNSLTGSGNNSTATVSNLSGAYIVKTAECATCPHRAAGGLGNLNVYVQLVQGAPDAVGRGTDEGSLLKTVVLVE